jgi:hypothetical protein
MNKDIFRARGAASLPAAVAQGNNLIMAKQTATQAWNDLDLHLKNCRAMCVSPGALFNYTRNQELMGQLTAEQVRRAIDGQDRVANQLKQSMDKLEVLSNKVKTSPARTGSDPQEVLVAALDMSMEINDWISSFHLTVFAAMNDTLQPFREAPLNLSIPIFGEGWKPFNPNEVGVG